MPTQREQAAVDTQPDELAELFIRVSRLIGRTGSRAKTGSLSNARYELLHTLLHHGPEPMGRVAARLGVTPRTVTEMVDALEGEGYLLRAPHPTDRRAHLLHLTPEGLALVKTGRRARLRAAGALFASLDPEERSALAALLGKVGDRAEDLREPGPATDRPHHSHLDR
jgi:DNA-binding MarR family transcriptional regulator